MLFRPPNMHPFFGFYMVMNSEDFKRLQGVRDLLENPGLAAKLTNVIGMPFEKAFDYLPAKWSDAIQTVTQKSLRHALDVAIKTISHSDRKSSNDILHKILVVASAVPVIGAAGGALINSIFMDHFQNMARGHFIMRNLEKIYGTEEVSRVYHQFS